MKKVMGVVAVAMAAFGAGCSGNASGSGTDTNMQGGIDANTRYVVEPDQAKAQQIAARMWSIMTAAPCWYAQSSTYNYSFSGTNDYRYAGYETTAGQVGVNSLGAFGGYDAADVQISSTQYWIGIADAKTMAISFIHTNGALVTTWYTAAAQGQLCV